MNNLPITQHQADAFASGLNCYAERLQASEQERLDFAAFVAGGVQESYKPTELTNGTIVLNDAYALIQTSAGYLATTINPASLLSTSDLGMVSL